MEGKGNGEVCQPDADVRDRVAPDQAGFPQQAKSMRRQPRRIEKPIGKNMGHQDLAWGI
jgi:hypothetical protein